MNPENLGFNECDSANSILQNLHKVTQTGKSSIDKESEQSIKSVNTPRSPSLSNITTEIPTIINESSDNGSIRILKFRQVFEDSESPKSLTIFRESITEEIDKHPNNYFTEDSTSKRYRYCREVIKPYLKDCPADCPSDNILIQDALDSVNEEFPDYQPCYEIYKGKKDIKEKQSQSDKSISCKSSHGSELSKLDVATSCKNSNTFSMDSKKSDENLSKKGSSSKIHSSPSSEKSKKKCSKSPEHPGDEKLVDSTKLPAQQESPIHVTEKPKLENSTSDKTEQKEKTMIDSHGKTIVTLKNAMEDFATKVCATTKDVVTVIKSESVRHLESFKTDGVKHLENIKTEGAKHLENIKAESAKHLENIKTESAKHLENIKTESAKHLETLKTESAKHLENFKKSKSSWTDTFNTKFSENKGSETTTSFNFFRKIESQHNEKTDKGTESNPLKSAEALQGIVKEIDSKVSMISQKISDALKPSDYNDRSSAYDIPIKKHDKPPKQVSNIIVRETVPASSSVFSAIKSKIYSLFSEPEKIVDVDNVSMKSSSSSSCGEDTDDEELIDRLID